MKAFFVGGVTDNSELDLNCAGAPAHYPEDTGAGVARYQLHRCVERDGKPLFAIYAPPDLAPDVVDRIVAERRYPDRFAPGHAPG
jgi:hypothetical protein